MPDSMVALELVARLQFSARDAAARSSWRVGRVDWCARYLRPRPIIFAVSLMYLPSTLVGMIPEFSFTETEN